MLDQPGKNSVGEAVQVVAAVDVFPKAHEGRVANPAGECGQVRARARLGALERDHGRRYAAVVNEDRACNRLRPW